MINFLTKNGKILKKGLHSFLITKLKANTLLIEIQNSDEARSWVESNFDTDSHSTRSYVKKSDTQYYVTENNSNWYQLFFNYTYLTKVIDGNTSNVTNMKYMFANCTSLTSVSLPNTSSVTNMNYMFINCTSLTSVSLPNTGRVTTMIYMFSGCTSLTSIPDLDTSKVTTMIYMFYDCTNIQTGMLAFYQEASSKSVAVASYTNCFKNCGTYTTQGMEDRAQIPESWGGDKIELAANTLWIELSESGTTVESLLTSRFDSWTSLGNNQYTVTKSSTNDWNGLLGDEQNPDLASKLVKVIDGNTSNITNMANMFSYCTSLTSVSLPDTSNVEYMNTMFIGCYLLTSVTLPNTGSVINMYQMFSDCTSLTSVSLPDTGSVTSMSGMFYNCTSLTSVSLPNTGSVTNMYQMFSDCTSLTSVSLPDTGSVTNMKYMFSDCTSLTSVPNLDTSKVTGMSCMFYNCTNIQIGMLAFYQNASSKSVAVTSYSDCFTNAGTSGGFNATYERSQIPQSWGGDKIELAANSLLIEFSEITADVKTDLSARFDKVEYITGTNKCIVTKNSNDWEKLFYNCDENKNATSENLIKVIDGNVSNITSMYYMFGCCYKLESVNLPNTDSLTTTYAMFSMVNYAAKLSYVNMPKTGNVTDMSFMFEKCSNITSIPELDTHNVTKMTAMFRNCERLAAITPMNTEKVYNVSEMFAKCRLVQTGILDFYNALTDPNRTTPVTEYGLCFTECGTYGGEIAAAEREQLPEKWKKPY